MRINNPSRVTPALLTRMSMRDVSARRRSAVAATAAHVMTQSPHAQPRRPRARDRPPPSRRSRRCGKCRRHHGRSAPGRERWRVRCTTSGDDGELVGKKAHAMGWICFGLSGRSTLSRSFPGWGRRRCSGSGPGYRCGAEGPLNAVPGPSSINRVAPRSRCRIVFLPEDGSCDLLDQAGANRVRIAVRLP